MDLWDVGLIALGAIGAYLALTDPWPAIRAAAWQAQIDAQKPLDH